MAAGNASAVEFRSVVKAYGVVRAVNDITFTIEPATLVTLLGPSGCGKTTTLRLIAGLEIATSGQIFIGGQDVTLRSAAERDVSMVFQSYALFPHMSVFENVAYGPTVQGLPKARVKELVHVHVLNDFAKSEWPWVEGLCDIVADNVGLLVSDKDSTFQNKVHLAMQAKGFGTDKDNGAKD